MLPILAPALVTMAVFAAYADAIKDDENVVFFPTFGRFDAEAGVWNVAIHGWIFEPETDSRKRAAALGLLRHLLGLEANAEETAIFRERARTFLVDNERGKELSIRLAGKTHPLGKSAVNGHFQANLRLTKEEADAALHEQAAASAKTVVPNTSDKAGPESRPASQEMPSPGRLTFTALSQAGDRRTFAGSVQLIDDSGVSVISDIDDTIKVSNVRHRRELLANTFLRKFQPAEGMADLYTRWQRAGAAFHYVSAGPWQLFAPLEEFRRAFGFPQGTFDMQLFRIKDSSSLNFLGPHDEHKIAAIEPLLAAFPNRRFVLVGDSGERDPEIYGTLARKYPKRIAHIFIRNVTKEDPHCERFRTAFHDVPEERWRVFEKVEEIKDVRVGE